MLQDFNYLIVVSQLRVTPTSIARTCVKTMLMQVLCRFFADCSCGMRITRCATLKSRIYAPLICRLADNGLRIVGAVRFPVLTFADTKCRSSMRQHCNILHGFHFGEGDVTEPIPSYSVPALDL
jgi:hypothetical protein